MSGSILIYLPVSSRILPSSLSNSNTSSNSLLTNYTIELGRWLSRVHLDLKFTIESMEYEEDSPDTEYLGINGYREKCELCQ